MPTDGTQRSPAWRASTLRSTGSSIRARGLVHRDLSEKTRPREDPSPSGGSWTSTRRARRSPAAARARLRSTVAVVGTDLVRLRAVTATRERRSTSGTRFRRKDVLAWKEPSGLTSVYPGSWLPDGRTLFEVSVDAVVEMPRRSFVGGVFVQGRFGRWADFVVNPVDKTARRVSPWTRGLQSIAFEPSGAFLVIEDSKRIVRFGPGPDDRTVVFPRPAAGR